MKNYRNMQGRLSLPQVFVDRDEAFICGALGQYSWDDPLNAKIDSMRFPQTKLYRNIDRLCKFQIVLQSSDVQGLKIRQLFKLLKKHQMHP